MTAPDSNIPDTVRHERKGRHDEVKGGENGYSATEHSNNMGSDDSWINSKQPSLANTINTNDANFTRTLNNHGSTNSEENNGQINYFDMQNNSYFKAGYPDSKAYYGWMPAGFSPMSMRLPALISPYSFLGFAPTVAWMKSNDIPTGPVANIEKLDRWKGKDGASSTSSDAGSQDSTSFTDKYDLERARDTTQSIHSDEDEGLVLDERDMLKRRRQKEVEKLQTQTITPQLERSSVIQPNVSIQAKPSVDCVVTQAQDSTTTAEQEQTKPAKRGRASTRQIEKTEQYWDRRKKNNVSAKKSRDARRQREAMMNQRSAMLETENLRVRAELATLRDENARLKQELNSLKKTQS